MLLWLKLSSSLSLVEWIKWKPGEESLQEVIKLEGTSFFIEIDWNIKVCTEIVERVALKTCQRFFLVTTGLSVVACGRCRELQLVNFFASLCDILRTVTNQKVQQKSGNWYLKGL